MKERNYESEILGIYNYYKGRSFIKKSWYFVWWFILDKTNIITRLKSKEKIIIMTKPLNKILLKAIS